MLLSLSEQLAQIDNFAGEETNTKRERDGQRDSRRRSQSQSAACNSNWKLLISIKTFDIGAYLCVALSSQLLSNLSRKFFSFPVSRFSFLVSHFSCHNSWPTSERFCFAPTTSFILLSRPTVRQPASQPARPHCPFVPPPSPFLPTRLSVILFSWSISASNDACAAPSRVELRRAKVKYSLPRDLYYRSEVIDQNCQGE